jgi:antitoxin component YwqK of YwqJK toxin-antitoxin module
MNGLKHGKGEWFFPGGERREGTFKNDLEDGISIATYSDGTKAKIIFKDDKVISKEKME